MPGESDLSRFDVLAEWRNDGTTALSVWCNAPQCLWHHEWPADGEIGGSEGRADLVAMLTVVATHPPRDCPARPSS